MHNLFNRLDFLAPGNTEDPRLLLCTDLDRTLIPNGREPESPRARERLASFVDRAGATLVYVTGRDRVLVEAAIAEYELPWPRYVIGDLGTSIHALDALRSTPDAHALGKARPMPDAHALGKARPTPDAHDLGEARPMPDAHALSKARPMPDAPPNSPPVWRPLPRWRESLTARWPGPDAPRASLAGLPGLRLQEAEKQTRFKLSYYVDLDLDTEALLARARERLDAASPGAQLVWSIDEAAGVGLLDILPEAAGKYRALLFLMQALGHREDETVFAGDSGNDLDALVSPIPAVLVANAHPEVREQARREAEAAGLGDRLYQARGQWQGLNGNYAAGILESVAHFRPDLRPLLAAPASAPTA